MSEEKNKRAVDYSVTLDEIHSDESHQAVTPGDADATQKHKKRRKKNGLFNISKAINKPSSQEGTVVSDKRRRKHTLWRGLVGAFQEWSVKIEAFLEERGKKPKKDKKGRVLSDERAHLKEMSPEEQERIDKGIRTYERDVMRLQNNAPQAETKEKSPKKQKEESKQNKPENIEVNSAEDKKVLSKKIIEPISEPVAKEDEVKTSSHLRAAPRILPTVTKAEEKSSEAISAPRQIAELPKKVLPPHLTKTQDEKTGPSRVVSSVMPQSPNELKKNSPAPDIKEKTSLPTPQWKRVSQPTDADLIPNNLPVMNDALPTNTPIPQKPKAQPKETKTPAPVPQKTEISQPVSRPIQKISTLPETETTVQKRPEPQPPETSPAQSQMREQEPKQKVSPDFAKIVSQRKAEREKERPRKQKRFPLKNILRIIGAIIAGGVFAGAIFLLVTQEKPDIAPPDTTPVEFHVPSSIPVLSQTPVPITDTPRSLLAKLRSMVAPSSETIVAFVPLESSTQYVFTAEEFLDFIDARLDAGAKRTLTDEYMIGSVMTDEAEPFVLFDSRSFDHLFVGMLAWEKYLVEDFAPFFGEVGSTTPAFVDAVRENLPARVLRNEEGEVLLLYAFVDRERVIITTSNNALSIILANQ